MQNEEVTNASNDHLSDRKFVDFPISDEVLQGILDMGFVTATPVQAATVEMALGGRDMIVRAKTGTGKTAAFCVPMIESIPTAARKATAVVLAPTRELAQQIAEQAEGIAAHKDIAVTLLVGGVAMGPQESALREGAEMIVGTPGRILDHIRRGNLDLSAVKTVCLDEADEMLSMGFFQDVTSIIEATPAERQILLFSATISADTQRLVQRYLREPEEVMLSYDGDNVSQIEHILYETRPGFHKARSLLYLIDIEDPSSAIIFCNTREDTATVASYLDRQGLDAQLISGELSQSRRNAVMAKVKRGEVRFLVATDVAARGIDISDLSHVINYALPQDPAVYLHRTGRTGRIGKKGRAISLVGGTDLNTRNQLVGRHGIQFIEKELPDAESAVRLRVDRQAEQIRGAMGRMVFEAYLPTVRALKEREDGEMLLAAALRAFFRWDRERRAVASEVDTIGEIQRARAEKADRKRPEREKDRDGGRRGRDRDRDRDRGGRKSSRQESTEDLDDLLIEADADAPASSDDAPPAPTDDAKKRRKRRRRRTKKSEDGSTTESADSEDGDDAIDAALSVDDAPAEETVSLDDLLIEDAPTDETAAPALDDLDALLDLD